MNDHPDRSEHGARPIWLRPDLEGHPAGRRPAPTVGGYCGGAADPPGCTITVCNGASCRVAHPRAARVLDELRAVVHGSTGDVLVRSLGCLGFCDAGSIVVVERRGDPTGAPSLVVWVAVRDAEVVAALAGWVRDGGPGVAPIPAAVDDAVVTVM